MPKEPQPGSAEADTLHLFTDSMVDLDLFSSAPVRYKVPRPDGTQAEYLLSPDPPWGIGLTFLRAKDRRAKAVMEVARARSEAAKDALVGKVDAEHVHLLDAFADLIRVTVPDFDRAELDRFGEGVINGWIETVATRLQLMRLGPDVQSFLAAVIEGTAEDADPKATPSGSPA